MKKPVNPIANQTEYHKIINKLKQELLKDNKVYALLKELDSILTYEYEKNIAYEERFVAQLVKSLNYPPARTAIISDIHGNYDGLLAALEDIKKQNCDRILCLGDIVEGGEDN